MVTVVKRSKKAPVYSRECPVCLMLFETQNPTKVYCSLECRYEREKEKQRARNREYRLRKKTGKQKSSRKQVDRYFTKGIVPWPQDRW